jgi:C-terminal peptidase prc
MIFLVSCAKAPPPAVKPREEPQLKVAIVLAQETLDKMAAYHVTPLDRDKLVMQFDTLMRGTSIEHPPVGHQTKHTVAAILNAWHAEHPRQPILPQVVSVLARLTLSLKDRSAYLDPQQRKALTGEDTNAGAAIGVYIQARGPRVEIIEVMAGSPAERAGLKAGDKILAIDGESATGKSLESVATSLRGAPESRVSLKIEFRDGDSRTISLQRENIEMQNVAGHWLTHGIAYVRIHRLLHSTLDEFNKTFLGLISKVGAPHGLVLDLRDNPGGLLDSAVQLADIFLERGTILQVKGRSPSDSKYFQASPRSEVLEQKLPIVVLVNGNTASGAESLVAALQDHKRAVIVGSRTTGVGLVHTLYLLPGERALKLATHNLSRASGEVIEKHGVVPDVCINGKQVRIIRQTNNTLTDEACHPAFSRASDMPDIPLQVASQILTHKTDYRQILDGTLTTLEQQ